MTRSSFSYDFPPASTSCNAQAQKREATRAADVARLLDPSYTHGSSPRHKHSPSSSPRSIIVSAYVDTHGDLHDPDYRDFPTLVVDDADDDEHEEEIEEWAPAAFASERLRKRRLTEVSSRSSGGGVYSPRDYEYSYGSLPNSSALDSKPQPPHTSLVQRYRCRGGSTSTTTTTPSLVFTPSSSTAESTYMQTSISTTSLPQYIDTSLLSATPSQPHLSRITSTPPSLPAPLSPLTSATSSSTAKETRACRSNRDVLRRQWQAVSLRVRFGVFRAGRRWGVV